ncbi:tetratricopeptide repeat protein [Kaarinaea lacus]
MIEAIHSPHIHEGTTDNFKSLVLENSNNGPVLVNFWSRKAGPCLRQYPLLDKLVHDYGGRLLLVNVDTEKEFVFTKEYGIASVPTLKLFRFGNIVETLHGYQSEQDLKKVLDLHVARQSDKTLADAIHRYAAGKTEEAYDMIANAIVADPVNPRLPLAMCKLLKHEQRYQEAMQLIEASPDNIRKDKDITQLHALLSFYVDAEPSRELESLVAHAESSPEDMSVKRQLVAYYVIHQLYENALQQLVNIIELDQKYAENYAQKATLKIFMLLGDEHPLVSQYRPTLKRYVH